jgi:hypothetical protein
VDVFLVSDNDLDETRSTLETLDHSTNSLACDALCKSCPQVKKSISNFQRSSHMTIQWPDLVQRPTMTTSRSINCFKAFYV